MAFHHSRKSFYRSPYGAQPVDGEVRLRVDVPATATAVTLRLWYSDGGEVLLPMKMMPVDGEIPPMVTYEATFKTNAKPGWVWYYFIIDDKSTDPYEGSSHIARYYYGNNEKQIGGPGAQYSEVPPAYQITVYDPNLGVPAWTKDSVMYHIFIDRFRRGESSPPLGTGLKAGQVVHPLWEDEPLYGRDEKGNVLQYDFFGGDLQGIIDAIPYLQNLGVNLLYLSPLMDSISNHKYDVGNYKMVDPAFGDDRLFRLLTAKAHAHGMKVIIDGVFSHNGADSLYFNRFGHYDSLGAYQSQESPYLDWYTFTQYPDDYECWWGMTNMPNVKEDTPSYLQYMLWNWDSVVNHWHASGIDGWRLDVADELPDTFLKPFRQAVKGANPEAFIIGEVWEDASKKEAYGQLRPYLQGAELDSVMNYPFRKILIDTLCKRMGTKEALDYLFSLYENYPRPSFFALMNLLSSHDERRILTELGEAPSMEGWTLGERRDFRLSETQLDLAKKRYRLALMWQFTFPGIPDIYYGDEAGMEGDKDPFNRRPYPWGHEDRSLIEWVSTMANMRRSYNVLRRGTLESILDYQMVAFARSTAHGEDAFGEPCSKEIAYVYLNIDEETRERSIKLKKDFNWTYYRLSEGNAYQDEEGHFLEGECIHNGDGEKTVCLTFGPYEGVVIIGEHVENEGIALRHGAYSLNAVDDHTELGEDLAHRTRHLTERAFDTMFKSHQKKPCGILMHPTSLPSEDGVGDLGSSAYEWVDFLANTGQTYWQILPLTEPALANSPYTAYSAVAGDRRLISLDWLVNHNLIDGEGLTKAREARKQRLVTSSKGEDTSSLSEAVDTVSYVDTDAYAFKEPFFKEAFMTFKGLYAAYPHAAKESSPCNTLEGALVNSFTVFCATNDQWLESYALFQALKNKYPTQPWHAWGSYKDYDYAIAHKDDFGEDIFYMKFLQWLFYRQWQSLHAYANEKNVYIIGDLPFFMAYDSADVWAHREYFDLDEEGNMQTVAGVPPDYFCKDGQHWGNPQYNWEALKRTNYEWWINNVENLLNLVDVLRLDHFRAYESFWAIPKDAPTAATGHWEKGPGLDLFKVLYSRLEQRERLYAYKGILLIAEDLGIITQEVEDLRRQIGLLGMRVLQFSFSEDPLPFSDVRMRILYTGTHDNNTLMGWLKELEEKGDSYTKSQLLNYLGLPSQVSDERIAHRLLEEAYNMDSAMTIVPIQDLLGLDERHRMNIPGVVNDTNWLWRLPEKYLTEVFVDKVKSYMRLL